MKKSYCTNAKCHCSDCNLSNYGMDCAGNKIRRYPANCYGSKRIDKALKKLGVFNMYVTSMAILAAVPQELKDELTSNQLYLVMKALNEHFHNARASMGAEALDNNACWIDAAGKIVEWDNTEEGAINPRFYESKLKAS